MGNSMGNMITSSMKRNMEENMQQQQEFMVATQKMNMERQMTMQQLMQQKMLAMQMARTKEMFDWIAGFASTLSLVLLGGALKTKNPRLLAPLLPLSFVVGYQYDMIYGNKMERIRMDAEDILEYQKENISLPNGPVTFTDVENVLGRKSS